MLSTVRTLTLKEICCSCRNTSSNSRDDSINWGLLTNPPAHIEEIAHLTNKLQQLAITLQLHRTCRPVEESLQTAMQKYTDTSCAPLSDKWTSTHVFTSRHPYIWLMGHHKVRRLAHWYQNGSWHLEGELCMPGWGQITWLNPHTHLARHFKLGSAGTTLGIYFI